MPQSMRTAKLSTTMRDALDGFFRDGCDGVMPDFHVKPGTAVALINRGLISTSHRARYQILPAGAAVLGIDWADVVERHHIAALAEYAIRAEYRTLITEDWKYEQWLELNGVSRELRRWAEVHGCNYAHAVLHHAGRGMEMIDPQVTGSETTPAPAAKKLTPAMQRLVNALETYGYVDMMRDGGRSANMGTVARLISRGILREATPPGHPLGSGRHYPATRPEDVYDEAQAMNEEYVSPPPVDETTEEWAERTGVTAEAIAFNNGEIDERGEPTPVDWNAAPITRDEMIEVGGGLPWVHPTTGEERLYFNAWPELIGLDVEYYKTGNVSGATLKGDRISNAEATRILGGKVFWANGKIVTSFGATRFHGTITAGIRDLVATVRAEADRKRQQAPADRSGVHAAHCCRVDGCKYNDDACPVVAGTVAQEYPCEECPSDLPAVLRAIADALDAGLPVPLSISLPFLGSNNVSLSFTDRQGVASVNAWAAFLGLTAEYGATYDKPGPNPWRSYRAEGPWGRFGARLFCPVNVEPESVAEVSELEASVLEAARREGVTEHTNPAIIEALAAEDTVTLIREEPSLFEGAPVRFYPDGSMTVGPYSAEHAGPMFNLSPLTADEHAAHDRQEADCA